MIEDELQELIGKVQRRGCEWQTTEVKSARRGCPERLYDTISAFSNQDDGGVMLFGLDEQNKFEKVGVYDAQALQKKVMEYCEQMTPAVRPVFTVWDEEGKVFVSAEFRTFAQRVHEAVPPPCSLCNCGPGCRHYSFRRSFFPGNRCLAVIPAL